MNPGPKLDALIAEKVMGCTVACRELVIDETSIWVKDPNEEPRLQPPDTLKLYLCKCPAGEHHSGGGLIKKYSTDIAATWEVVEKTGLLGEHNLLGGHGSYWSVSYYYNNDEWEDTKGVSAPHAICLAALKSVGALKK